MSISTKEIELVRENVRLKLENQQLKVQLQEISNLAQTCLEEIVQLRTDVQNLEQRIEAFKNREFEAVEGLREKFRRECRESRFPLIVNVIMAFCSGLVAGSSNNIPNPYSFYYL